jgi:murein DD-endopeptidase MepM/ murein hydrolase activator NlpD
MPRTHTFQRIASCLGIAALLCILAGVNLFTRDSSLRDLNKQNDPLYYAHETAEDASPDDQHGPVTLTASVDRGDTLAKVLAKAQVSRADAFAAVEALRKVYNPKDLQAGQQIDLSFQPGPDDESAATFLGFSFEPSMEEQIDVTRGANGGFTATSTRKQLTKQLVHASGTIDTSLYVDATAAGIPAQVLVEAIRALSFDVDFQREIQPQDSFDIAYERYTTDEGATARLGDMVYASLTLGNKTLKIYRYLPRDGIVDYFNEKGESVRKALLRTPVDGARITSKFSKARSHPILGFTRAHKGVDFGVPKGTPIMAAGSGVVVEAGVRGGYGNYVRIRHNPQYSTAYAHLSGFARGIRRGARVSQGQVIGYVGMTGLATGPHLHYEVLVNNTQVNPLGIKLISGQKLRGAELANFMREKKVTDAKLADLPAQTALVSKTID